jgi:branched-chain amino acid transport system ATP-binding protein
VLHLENVHTYYGESHILHGISLAVEEKKLSVILGRNGMGKTTTIRTIIGFNQPRRGKVVFRGKEIQRLPSYQIARLGIGLSPQGRSVFPNLSVKENLLLAARDGSGSGWSLEKIYALFPRLKEREGFMGGDLSGGEQQMLSMGRALMTNPALLLLDEPSEGLSPLMVQEVKRMIRALKEAGLSILMVEQNVNMALSLADTVYIVNKGQVVFAGTPEELQRNTQIKRDYLGITS